MPRDPAATERPSADIRRFRHRLGGRSTAPAGSGAPSGEVSPRAGGPARGPPPVRARLGIERLVPLGAEYPRESGNPAAQKAPFEVVPTEVLEPVFRFDSRCSLFGTLEESLTRL